MIQNKAPGKDISLDDMKEKFPLAAKKSGSHISKFDISGITFGDELIPGSYLSKFSLFGFVFLISKKTFFLISLPRFIKLNISFFLLGAKEIPVILEPNNNKLQDNQLPLKPV